MRVAFLAITCLATLSFACASLKAQVQQRAAFDLQCDVEKIDVKFLDANHDTAGASGCGRQATYVNAHGTWVKNSETTGGAAPQGQTATTSAK